MLFASVSVQNVIAQSDTTTNIIITQPRDSATVRQYGETIAFRTNVPVEENYFPVVFVKDPINKWWPLLTAKSNDRQAWRLENVQFGVASDKGQRFRIQVLLLSLSDIDSGISLSIPGQCEQMIFIEAGSPLRTSLMVQLRNGQQIISNVVTVQRE